MKVKNDGGPAFPGKGFETVMVSGYPGLHEVDMPGMPLRDYFAIRLAASITVADTDDNVSWPKTSEMAYAGADAMLAERDKE